MSIAKEKRDLIITLDQLIIKFINLIITVLPFYLKNLKQGLEAPYIRSPLHS